MYEIVICPHCQGRLKVPTGLLGQQVRCTQCSTVFAAGIAWAKPDAEPDEADAGAVSLPPFEPPPISPLPRPADAAPLADALTRDEPPMLVPRKPRRPQRSESAAIVKKSRRSLWVFAGVCVVLCLCIFGVLRGRRQPQEVALNAPGFAPPVADDLFADHVEEVPPPPLQLAEERLREMQTFFQRFSQLIQNHQSAELARCFASAQIVDDLFAQKMLPKDRQRDKKQLRSDVAHNLAESMLLMKHWFPYEITYIEPRNDRTLVVFTRHHQPGAKTSMRMRWWLVHRQGRWQITDLELTTVGFHLVAYLGNALDHFKLNLRKETNLLIQATFALEDLHLNECDRLLDQVHVAELPPQLAGTHHILRAVLRLHQQRPQDVLTSCAEAERSNPDMPGLALWRAMAHNGLKQYDRALEQGRKFQAWLGDDYEVCDTIGIALQETHQFDEAARYYRKTLDAEPQRTETFFSLLRCLGTNVNNDDIGERFSKLPRPQDLFQQYAQDRWSFFDTSSLEKLCLAMRKIEPGHAEAEFYLALAHMEQKRTPEAVATLRTALKLQHDEPRRQQYYAEFAKVAVHHQDALRAFAGLPYPRRAFRTLAQELKKSYRMDDLQELIEQYAQAGAGDPYRSLYQGDVSFSAKKFAEADRAYTKAFHTLKDLGLETMFHHNRVSARSQSGDLLGAYRDIPPRRATFEQLANQCWFDKKPAELQILVDLHAKAEADDPQLPRSRWRLKILHQRFDEAGALLQAALAPLPGPEQKEQRIDDFLYDMIDAKQMAAAYRLAPDPAHAFERMVEDLLEAHQLPDLKNLCDLHRKQFPKDPLLAICAGQLALEEQRWPEAAQAFSDGWQRLPAAKQPRWLYAYLRARYKAGQAVLTYLASGRRREDFRILSQLILADQQVDLFEQLLEAHRPQRAQDPEFEAYEARLQWLHGQTAAAADLFHHCLQTLPENDKNRVASAWINDLAGWNKAVELYRCVPDKRSAFQQLSWRYRNAKQVETLAKLIDEHAQHHADDPRLLLERGELHLLRNEPAQADQQFVLARQKNLPGDAHAVRTGLLRARIRLGKTVPTYRELGANAPAFHDLAQQCMVEKNPAQLQALIAVYRHDFPRAKTLPAWEMESLWLRKDFAATVRFIAAQHADLLDKDGFRWKAESYLVRSLVRLQQPKEALQQAERMQQKAPGNDLMLVLALAATGDVQRTLAYVEKKRAQTYLIETYYRDEDLGPLLRRDAFRAFRDRFPEPPALLQAPG